MMLSTRLFTFFFTFIFILSTSEFADARATQKKGRNTIESEKRLDAETANTNGHLTSINASLTLRLLDQMKTCIYAQLLENGSMTQWTKKKATIYFR